QDGGGVVSSGGLYGANPEGCEGWGPAGGEVKQDRVGHQRPNRQDTRPHGAAEAIRAGRRDDRVIAALHISADGTTRKWRLGSAVSGYWGGDGQAAHSPPTPSLSLRRPQGRRDLPFETG